MFIQIVLLILLILLNGLFAASEIAFLSVNKARLHNDVKNNNKKAIKVKKLVDNPSSFLATIQIGITFAGFLASAFAAEAFADEIVIGLSGLGVSSSILKPIIVIIVTIILSYFTLVFGELVPKRLAMRFPEKIAYSIVGFITILMKITYPFVWFLTKSTDLVAKLFGIKGNTQQKITEDEIRLMIAEGMDVGAIEAGEKALIDNVFRFNDIKIKDIMTQKSDVVSVEINISNKDLLKVIKSNKYTRIPVYENEFNHIVGVLNTKDIIHNYLPNGKFALRENLNKTFFVNESDDVDEVFRKMQKAMEAISVVLDEAGNVTGIVTLEDALEEIVGNIFDEYDKLDMDS